MIIVELATLLAYNRAANERVLAAAATGEAAMACTGLGASPGDLDFIAWLRER